MVNWTAEKDQQLLKGVFQFCEIKCNAPLLKHLADLIGEDCTPKAVQHRLNNVKNPKGSKDPKDSGSAASTPSKPIPTKKPASSARGRGRQFKVKSTSDEDDPKDNDEDTPSPTANRKRGRKPKSAEMVEAKDDDEDGDEHAAKKVKKEHDDFNIILGSGLDGQHGDGDNADDPFDEI